MTSHSDSPVSSPSFTEPTGNPSSVPLSIPNDSSRGTTSHGPDKVQEVKNITKILCEKLGEVQIQARKWINNRKEKRRSNGQTISINMLPDNVLLEIFDSFLLKDYDCDWDDRVPVSTWHVLVHVCQRWRQIVSGSPHRLNVHIYCTNGTPVRETLDCWPPLPIAIRYDQGSVCSFPGDKDGIFIALEHHDRLRQIHLSLMGLPPGPHFDKVATLMQVPFPSLTHLNLRYQDQEDNDWYTYPDSDYQRPSAPTSGFLGGSAPCLQYILLGGIPFPALPVLLSSTRDLIYLELCYIPKDGYISPEAMVACLGALPRLKVLCIEYSDSAPSHPDRILLPPVTRTLLPALTSISLRGGSEYLEEFMSRIDSPQAKRFTIEYLEPFNFQFPQFFDFIKRSNNLEITSSKHADVQFYPKVVCFRMYPRPDIADPDSVWVTAHIHCREGKVSRIARVFRQHSALLSRVVHLKLTQSGTDGDDDEWLRLLLQFSAVRTLHVFGDPTGAVVRALEHITGEMVTEVFPVLDLIYFNFYGRRRSIFKKFLKARRLSGHSVTKINKEAEFVERVKCYVSQ